MTKEPINKQKNLKKLEKIYCVLLSSCTVHILLEYLACDLDLNL